VNERTIYKWIAKYINKIKSSESREDTAESNFSKFATYVKSLIDTKPVTAREVDVSLDAKRILLVCMSDLHIGSKFQNIRRLADDAKLIAETENVFAVVVGDITDAGPKSPTPKNLDHDAIVPFNEQLEGAKLLFDDIGHKVLAMTSGCHGAWFFNEMGYYYEQELIKKTESKAFLFHGGVLNLTVGNVKYNIFMSHKLHGGSALNPSRPAMRINELYLDFDVAITAHKHEASVNVSMRREMPVVAINCGSYKGLDTFANKEGYVDGPMCIPGILLDGETRRIIPFIDWRDGLDFVR
jgi:hypothetical protein